MKHPAPQKQKQNTNMDTQYQKKDGPHSRTVEKKQRKSQKSFNDTKIKIAFRTQNTMQNIGRQHPQNDKYNDSGIYEMKCLDYPPKYRGQTSRSSHHTRTKTAAAVAHASNQK
jgi:hypothetical protein